MGFFENWGNTDLFWGVTGLFWGSCRVNNKLVNAQRNNFVKGTLTENVEKLSGLSGVHYIYYRYLFLSIGRGGI